jgi:hypothetical protein
MGDPEWEVGLCYGCEECCCHCRTSNLCVMSYLPCFSVVSTRVASSLGYSWWLRVLLFVVVTVCVFLPVVLFRLSGLSVVCNLLLIFILCFLRNRTRARYGIRGFCGCFGDLVSSSCCFCCTQQQVATQCLGRDVYVSCNPDLGCMINGDI